MKLQVNAQTVYAYTGGKDFDPTLPCIVFVHGALHDHSVWTLLARWFAHHGHAVLALDLPGHGRSEGQALPSVEALGAWLVQVLDATGVQQAALVGHSMGSLIALEAAAQAPARATRVLMLGTAYPMKVSEALLETSRSAPLKAMEMVNVFSHSSQASKPSYPGPGAWLHGGNLQLMRHIQSGYGHGNLFEHDFRVCDAYAHGLEAAAQVTCPAHFILGERDQMTAPKQSQASKPSYPGPGAWLHGGNLQLMRRVQAGYGHGNLFEHDFRVCDAYAHGLEAAAQVTCPAHFILGERDQMTAPKQSQALGAALKASVQRVPAGHSMMAEAPEQVLTALRAALA